jgi:hypothetical protein
MRTSTVRWRTRARLRHGLRRLEAARHGDRRGGHQRGPHDRVGRAACPHPTQCPLGEVRRQRVMPWKDIPGVVWARGDTVDWGCDEAPGGGLTNRHGAEVVLYSGGNFADYYAVGALVRRAGRVVDVTNEEGTSSCSRNRTTGSSRSAPQSRRPGRGKGTPDPHPVGSPDAPRQMRWFRCSRTNRLSLVPTARELRRRIVVPAAPRLSDGPQDAHQPGPGAVERAWSGGTRGEPGYSCRPWATLGRRALRRRPSVPSARCSARRAVEVGAAQERGEDG